MVKIPKYVWIGLGLDDPRRLALASMCFYLGKRIEETRNIINGALPWEAIEVREIAPLSGYTKEIHELCL